MPVESIALQGSLVDDALGDVVRELYANRRSGVLHVSHGGVSKRIYFQKGSMVFANSDVEDDRLGELLMRQGIIDRAVFDRASEVLKSTGQRFGRAIVELGYLSPKKMESKVVEQIEAIIHSLFGWSHGEYRFEPKANPVDEDIVLNLSTANLLLEGTRRMADPARAARALGDRGQVLRHSENPLLLYQKIGLSPSEGFVLSRADGATTIDEIAALSPLEEPETLQCIFGLVSAGVLTLSSKGGEAGRASSTGAAADQAGAEPASEQDEWAGETVAIPAPEAETIAITSGDDLSIDESTDAASASPEEMALREEILETHAALGTLSPYELLGVAPDAGMPEIKRAYFAMAKKYHPDRHHSRHLLDVRDLLEELFGKIVDAYREVADREPRKPPEPKRPRSRRSTKSPPPSGATPESAAPEAPAARSDRDRGRAARERYAAGRRHYDEAHFFDAIQCLRDAVRLSPRSEYRKLLGQALMKNPRWSRDAEEQFRRVLEDDPFDAECLVGLGEIYEQAGMTTRARKLFEQAASYDPENATARKKLASKAPTGLARLLGPSRE